MRWRAIRCPIKRSLSDGSFFNKKAPVRVLFCGLLPLMGALSDESDKSGGSGNHLWNK